MGVDDPPNGDLAAVVSFDSLFVDEYPRLVALAAAVSGSRAHAEDLAQEALTRLDRHWDRIQGYEKPGAWLRRVTINLALSQKRARLAEAKALLRLGARRPPDLAPAPTEDDAVWEAVAALPKQQRAAIALRYLEDRSIDEIADILDVAPSTARVHLHRARQALHDALGAHDPAAPGPDPDQDVQ